MKHRKAILWACILALFVTPMYAQLNRAYVSVAAGNDSNSCSYAAPCRSLAKGVSVLNSGGEVILLDGGGFAAFTIDRSVIIQAPQSVFAGVIAASGNAITINAGPDGSITLRGLTLTGVGATNGINAISTRSLHLEDVVVSGFSEYGVIASGAMETFARRLTARNNGAGLFLDSTEDAFVAIADSYFDRHIIGVEVRVSRAQIEDTQFSGNDHGAWISNHGRMHVSRSTSSMGLYGFLATVGATLLLDDCKAVFNDVGIQSTGTVDVSRSDIAFNGTGLNAASPGADIYSRGNNTLRQNTAGNAFTGTLSESEARQSRPH